jgi:hypothetical protein
MGLGLALSREWVCAAGGQLTASNAPGAGAVFEIRLPTLSRPRPCVACREVKAPAAPVRLGDAARAS